jgi:1-acyl-sn-glycerol-3-phosphate acyltransferase
LGRSPRRGAIAGLARNAGLLFQDREARAALMALAISLSLIAGQLVSFLVCLERQSTRSAVDFVLQVGAGLTIGSVLAGIQANPRRALGLVPIGFTGLLIALSWAAFDPHSAWPYVVSGLMAALVAVPLQSAYETAVPAGARGHSVAVSFALSCILMTGTVLLTLGAGRFPARLANGAILLTALCIAIAVVIAWWALLRDALELLLEIVIWPFYRVSAHGPGIDRIPRRGPLIIIANHTAYFDPLWLGKVLPQRLTPAMTSDFYDRPGLHFLMAHVVHAIRVVSSTYRREAPELVEAVQRLDRGECLVIFPEGWVRRKAEVPLRRFAQGLWHILRERPNTPVVACWTEGGWGSYSSYWRGPPGVNKRVDWRRPIDIAVSVPCVLDASVLADQRTARAYLQQMCIDARRHLGLGPLDSQTPPNTPPMSPRDHGRHETCDVCVQAHSRDPVTSATRSATHAHGGKSCVSQK